MKIELPDEVVDAIVLAVLKEQYSYLKEELREHRDEGVWMHPEDAYQSEFKLVPSLEIIIKYFGGEI